VSHTGWKSINAKSPNTVCRVLDRVRVAIGAALPAVASGAAK
jgi:hypothetical protein